ncbi:hypothetical protein [Chitinophaga sp. YIM B06452]|uniref:hypothetical protein n=1 Tax=Chitinophaga sp. YIM B06452 TaxID=3082158 RepID=UPI0031FEECAF
MKIAHLNIRELTFLRDRYLQEEQHILDAIPALQQRLQYVQQRKAVFANQLSEIGVKNILLEMKAVSAWPAPPLTFAAYDVDRGKPSIFIS